jgi:CsoR family transcriptional regulator, copper-sensing transcriptional repressor
MQKHKEHIPKLNRIEGQLKAIKNMIEQERYCVDILTQLKAVRGALMRVQKEILRTHLETCVHSAIVEKNRSETEKKVKEVLKLLDEC